MILEADRCRWQGETRDERVYNATKHRFLIAPVLQRIDKDMQRGLTCTGGVIALLCVNEINKDFRLPLSRLRGSLSIIRGYVW